MKYLLYFALFGAAVFTACGDDSSNPVINEGTSSSFVFNRSSSSAVSSVPDGSFVDSRDGQVYKMVTIGNQVWMAQNLNFESPDSYCYEDKKDNCTKYGRLYKWSAAMDSAMEFMLVLKAYFQIEPLGAPTTRIPSSRIHVDTG